MAGTTILTSLLNWTWTISWLIHFVCRVWCSGMAMLLWCGHAALVWPCCCGMAILLWYGHAALCLPATCFHPFSPGFLSFPLNLSLKPKSFHLHVIAFTIARASGAEFWRFIASDKCCIFTTDPNYDYNITPPPAADSDSHMNVMLHTFMNIFTGFFFFTGKQSCTHAVHTVKPCDTHCIVMKCRTGIMNAVRWG